MATLDQFLPMIRGRLPGCPEAILKDAVRDACIEFCKRTRLLVQDVDVDVSAGEAATSLYPDADVAWEVLRVMRAERPLAPSSRSVCHRLGYQTAGEPFTYYLEGDRTLVLVPTPVAAETLTATVTVRPSDTTPRVPDVLWSDYREPICAGARAWVRRHYGEWSEPNLEAEDRLMFERAIHNQQVRRANGGVGLPLRVQSYAY